MFATQPDGRNAAKRPAPNLSLFHTGFCNPLYANHPLAAELADAFAPLKGSVARGCLKSTREPIGIVAIFGGQWPYRPAYAARWHHPASQQPPLDTRDILAKVREWFEQTVIGGNLDEWLALDTGEALFRWMTVSPAREHSALGLFNRFARDIGLHKLGAGTGHLMSFGANHHPDGADSELPAGFFNADTQQVEALNHLQINEHVRHSWFFDYPGGRHPWEGETIPDHQPGTDRYTWPRRRAMATRWCRPVRWLSCASLAKPSFVTCWPAKATIPGSVSSLPAPGWLVAKCCGQHDKSAKNETFRSRISSTRILMSGQMAKATAWSRRRVVRLAIGYASRMA